MQDHAANYIPAAAPRKRSRGRMSPQEGAEEAEEGNPGGGDVCGLTQWRSQALSHVTKIVHQPKAYNLHTHSLCRPEGWKCKKQSLSSKSCSLSFRRCLLLGLPMTGNSLEPLHNGFIPSSRAPYQDLIPSRKGPTS